MSRIRADRRVGLLLAGVVLLAFVALGASVALPATDPSLDVPAPEERSGDEARGMRLYRSEGCWYCHTQYVRDTKTDADLGEPLGAEAYAGVSPTMLGLERIGGDITHVDLQPDALADALKHHGNGPPFAYLSDDDLNALAAYLLSRGER